MTINSNINVRMHFLKLSATFHFEFYQLLPIFDFLISTYQEQALKTCLSLDGPTRKKSHEVRLGF